MLLIHTMYLFEELGLSIYILIPAAKYSFYFVVISHLPEIGHNGILTG